jgi:hypothetical protein
MKKTVIALLTWLIVFKSNAQQEINLPVGKGATANGVKVFSNDTLNKKADTKPHLRSLIVPGVFITYGLVSLGYDKLRDFDKEVKEEIWSEHAHGFQHVDNYLQFAPAVAVYALNLAGIHGKNNLRDRTMILLLSNIISNATVYSLKSITHRLRPNETAYTSFPSGHTAEVFGSAEFLSREYKNISPWYGIAGYATAATVGYLRIYNNKHWFSDIVAGAGIGMLSTKLAYWIYPSIKRILFKDRKTKIVLLPVFKNRSLGFTLSGNL